MDSRKVLFAILGGVALTTVIGFLLTPYKNSSKRKSIVEKVEETIKDSVGDVKNQFKIMDEDANRMVNEGGNTV